MVVLADVDIADVLGRIRHLLSGDYANIRWSVGKI
jgi:hypothetical protein